jgi:beta-glucanase (GH16 family)
VRSQAAPGVLTIALALLAGALPSTADAIDAPGEKPNCGPRLAKSSGGKWHCTFADDFSGTTIDTSKWVAQRTETSGYTSGPDACFVASANNIGVSDGTLKLTARREAEPFTCENPYGAFETQYTSGMVSTAGGRFSQTYGRFEFRARISAAKVKGLHSALWLWPENAAKFGPRPAAGEIDVAEMYSAYPDRAIPYIHYNPAAPDPNVTNNACMISNVGAFHTYAVEWTAASIKIIYDGKTCLVHKWKAASPLTGRQPFDQPFIVVLTQALGVATNAFDPATTPLPATTEIDHVRVWNHRPATKRRCRGRSASRAFRA